MADCIVRQIPTWSAKYDKPHCGVTPSYPLTELADDGLLQQYSADDNTVSWLKDAAMKETTHWHQRVVENSLQARQYQPASPDTAGRRCAAEIFLNDQQ